MDRHFTTSVYILHEEKVLLLFHPKLKKWLPPGGHLEDNESPPEAAQREVFEETGLKTRFLSQENVWVDRWNAKSFERPHLCLIEEIPPHKDVPAHQHLDFIYLAEPVGNPTPHGEDHPRYFTLEEVQSLESDVEIFAETQEVIASLFTMEVSSG